MSWDGWPLVSGLQGNDVQEGWPIYIELFKAKALYKNVKEKKTFNMKYSHVLIRSNTFFDRAKQTCTKYPCNTMQIAINNKIRATHH